MEKVYNLRKAMMEKSNIIPCLQRDKTWLKFYHQYYVKEHSGAVFSKSKQFDKSTFYFIYS